MSNISRSQTTHRSSQATDNLSFDETYQQSAVEILGEDLANNVLKRIQVDENGQVKVTLDLNALATSTNQTNGDQQTQIVGPDGSVSNVVDGRLQVGADLSLSAGDNVVGRVKLASMDGTRLAEVTGSNELTIYGNVGSKITTVRVGQTTSDVTAVQLSSTSAVASNGIIVQALAANTDNVYVGGGDVTTATGFEIQPGQSVPFTCSNITDLWVIGANATDGVCWNVL